MTATTHTAIAIESIIRSGDTQGRANMGDDNVANLMDVITQGIPFHTPIKLARLKGVMYLVDGFHRVEAYERLGLTEIPAAQCEITDVEDMQGVTSLAVTANIKHGKGATEADYRILIDMMIAANPDRYMKNAFEIDVRSFCEDFDMPRRMINRAYGDHMKAHETMSLSQQHKAKRNKAILEQHEKGLSARKIAEMFGISCHKTVSAVIDELGKNADSVKFPTPQETTPVLPLAATSHNDTTRVSTDDLAGVLDGLADEGEDVPPFALDDEWLEAPAEDPMTAPVTPVTPVTPAPVTPAVPSENDAILAAKADPSALTKEWNQALIKMGHMGILIRDNVDHLERLRSVSATIQRTIEDMDRMTRIATQAGISLS